MKPSNESININLVLKHSLYDKSLAEKVLQEQLQTLNCSEEEKQLILSSFTKIDTLINEATVQGMIYKRKVLAKTYTPPLSPLSI